jgi:peptidoglycan/LPS O-acetylase OafA/YrhL
MLFSSLGAVALVNALIFAPILIAVFAKVTMPESSLNTCKFLGDISYPLYVTHFPLYRLLYESELMNNLTPAAQTIVFATIAMGVAITLVKFDEYIRNSLKKRRLINLQNA